MQLHDYLDSEDAIGRWLEERCVTELESWTAVGALFANWQTWCERAGEREGSQKRFTQQVEAHGFQRARTSCAKGFTGIAIRQDVVPDVPGSPIFPVSRAHARTPYIEESGTSGIESPNIDLQGGPR